MTEFAGFRGGAPFTLGDVTVTPASPGYNIGIVDRAGWRFLNTAETWAQAIRKASWFSTMRGGRVWGSRDGHLLDPLVFEPLGFDGDYVWLPFNAASIHLHAPGAPGIYVLRAVRPIYIGESESLRDRLLFHLENPLPCRDASAELMFTFKVIEVPDKRIRRSRELITWWKPACNQ